MRHPEKKMKHKTTRLKRVFVPLNVIAFVLFATTASFVSAQTFTTLHSFTQTEDPTAALIQATDGSLYGTTFGNPYDNQGGTIFKITPTGTLTGLYSFCGGDCPDASNPAGALIQATNGDFYGTTEYGGTGGNGVVFKITPTGEFTNLYNFCSLFGCADGENPLAGLVQSVKGDLYGTTYYGGTSGHAGTIFTITPDGTFKTLYNFCLVNGCPDGENPAAALIQASNGNFYGTTQSGGANNAGTIFQITPSGVLTTLHSFCSLGCSGGSLPLTGLVQASNGDLYGTSAGGANGSGTIYSITVSGAFATLYSLCSQTGCPDGSDANEAGLVEGTDGKLYGTTYEGGANNSGTIFSITTAGALSTHYSFWSQSGCADGSGPYAALVQDTDGAFFGTTVGGGVESGGVVFSLSTGLRPFVKTHPASGTVGTVIKVLGTDLTGATSVSFNGVAAAFEVVSSTYIATTVPAGATSGKVKVVTPGGTLYGNKSFEVLP